MNAPQNLLSVSASLRVLGFPFSKPLFNNESEMKKVLQLLENNKMMITKGN